MQIFVNPALLLRFRGGIQIFINAPIPCPLLPRRHANMQTSANVPSLVLHFHGGMQIFAKICVNAASMLRFCGGMQIFVNTPVLSCSFP
jgi:hypothetical protein